MFASRQSAVRRRSRSSPTAAGGSTGKAADGLVRPGGLVAKAAGCALGIRSAASRRACAGRRRRLPGPPAGRMLGVPVARAAAELRDLDLHGVAAVGLLTPGRHGVALAVPVEIR